MPIMASGFYVHTAGFYTIRWTVRIQDFPVGSPANVQAIIEAADYPPVAYSFAPGDGSYRTAILPTIWLPVDARVTARVQVSGATVTPRPTISGGTFEVHALIP